jgi:two-component system nitrate/nitrite response regulator NarL
MLGCRSVLIIDDQPLFRKGMMQLLRMAPDMHVAADVWGGAEALALAQTLDLDLILVELQMKALSGLDVLRAVRAARLKAKVVIVTSSDSGEDVVAALRCGAEGYLLKDMAPEAMLEALREIVEGHVVIPAQLNTLLVAALRGEARPQSPETAGLTEQETRILEKIAEGLSNKQIGREFEIAEGTVKVHVKHILRKLELRSRVEAAVWAVERMRG